MSLTRDVTLPGRRVEHRHVRACLDALSATLRLWTQLLFAQRRPRAGKICAFTTSRLPSPSFSPLIQLFTSLPHLLATFLTLIPSILPGHNSFTLLDTSPPSHAYTPPLHPLTLPRLPASISPAAPLPLTQRACWTGTPITTESPTLVCIHAFILHLCIYECENTCSYIKFSNIDPIVTPDNYSCHLARLVFFVPPYANLALIAQPQPLTLSS